MLDLARPVSEEELRRLSELNPGYQWERSPEGRLWVSPTGGESGRRSLQLAYQLARWNEERGLGVVFDSSTGFKFPDGSILSPDAAFVERGLGRPFPRPSGRAFLPWRPRRCLRSGPPPRTRRSSGPRWAFT